MSMMANVFTNTVIKQTALCYCIQKSTISPFVFFMTLPYEIGYATFSTTVRICMLIQSTSNWSFYFFYLAIDSFFLALRAFFSLYF